MGGPKPDKVGVRRVDGPKGGRPEGWEGAKFRAFFRSFCVSLGVFSWNFGGVFEGQAGCRVKPEVSKRAHLTARPLPHTTKNPRQEK